MELILVHSGILLAAGYCLVATVVAAIWFAISKEKDQAKCIMQGVLVGLFWPLTVGVALYTALFASLVAFLEVLEKNLCNTRE